MLISIKLKLDSGTSTLPTDDNGYDLQLSPELDEETTNAMRILDSVVMNEEYQYDEVDSSLTLPTPLARKNIAPVITPRRRQMVAFETDRNLTEVSDGEAVEENFERVRVWHDCIYQIFFL